MTVSAKIRVSQLSPNDGTRDVLDKVFLVSGDYEIFHSSSSDEGLFSVHHLKAVQYPRPVDGQSGWLTEDNSDWSDSPTLDPTRLENQRWSFGRGPTPSTPGTYGRLSNYSGFLMNQVLYTKAGSYLDYDKEEGGEGTVKHLSPSVEGSVVVYEPENVSGDTTVSQFPFVVLANPEPFSYKNPVDTDVSIRLSNYAFPLSSGTISLTLDGQVKTLQISEFLSGLGGFDALWSNDSTFDNDQQVDVEWDMFDSAVPPNEILIKYWFRTVKDYLGPRISNISPVGDSTGADKDTCIEFTLRDFENGVNIDSLELYVNNVLIDNSVLTIDEVSTLDGYSVSYCPTESFLYGDEIPVSIYVEDISPEKNFLFHVFSFTTEVSLPPKLVGFDPEPCELRVPNISDVEFDIVDGGHGLDKDSIQMSVDEKPEENPRKLPIIYRDE